MDGFFIDNTDFENLLAKGAGWLGLLLHWSVMEREISLKLDNPMMEN